METETKKVDVKKILITLALVLFTAGAVGGGMYYVLNQNFNKERETNEKALKEINDKFDKLSTEKATTETKDEAADWKTYTNEAFGIAFKYPKEFTITKEENISVNNKNGGLVLSDNSRVGQPSLSLLFNPDGIGGCMLDADDFFYTTAINDGKVTITKKESGDTACSTEKRVISFIVGRNTGVNQNEIIFNYAFSAGDYAQEVEKIIKTISITNNFLAQ